MLTMEAGSEGSITGLWENNGVTIMQMTKTQVMLFCFVFNNNPNFTAGGVARGAGCTSETTAGQKKINSFF